MSNLLNREKADRFANDVYELVKEIVELDLPKLSAGDVIHVATAAKVAVADALCKGQRCPLCGSLNTSEATNP